MQRWTVHPLAGKVVYVGAVVAAVNMVGSHVERIGGNRHRRGKIHLLPPRSGFVGECHRRKARACFRPESAGVSADVAACLVEADGGYIAVDIRAELDPQLHRTVRAAVNQTRHCCSWPDGV